MLYEIFILIAIGLVTSLFTIVTSFLIPNDKLGSKIELDVECNMLSFKEVYFIVCYTVRCVV